MDFGAALALLGLALAWLLYRLQRAAAQRRDIDAALATLRAVRSGMLGHPDDLGWGDLYFVHGYNAKSGLDRAKKDGEQVLDQRYNQVLVVPTEPLRLLAASAGELISEETARAANFGPWKVGVFNQLVQAQTDWNVRNSAEIIDPTTPTARLEVLAHAALQLSYTLHTQGIGQANEERGWYRRLKDAVNANITHLEKERSDRTWSRNELHVRITDIGAALFAVIALAMIGWGVIDTVNGDDTPALPTPATPATTATTATTP